MTYKIIKIISSESQGFFYTDGSIILIFLRSSNGKKNCQKATGEYHSVQLSGAMGGVRIIEFLKRFFDKMNE